MHKFSIPDSVKFFEDNYQLSEELIGILSAYHSRSALFISGTNAFKALGEAIFTRCTERGINLKLELNPLINKDFIYNPAAKAYLEDKSPIIAVGGGKILDYAKYLAFKTERIFISIPSIASHDGIFSPISVISGFSLGSKMPEHLLVCLDTLKQAAILNIQSGIGDLIANITALNDFYLSQYLNGESLDLEAINLSLSGSLELIDFILEHRKRSDEKESLLDFLHNSEFLKQFMRSLVLSGMAMYKANSSRPCSGSEHLISHAIDAIYGHATKAAHGIQVAIASYYVYPRQLELLRKFKIKASAEINLDELFDKCGLPKCFSDIEISEEELKYVLELAPKTRKNKFSILDLSGTPVSVFGV
jgi:glycerol-1-phosphate dehydrogenase [NAD(P)+]